MPEEKKKHIEIDGDDGFDRLQDWVDNTDKIIADMQAKAEADEAVIKVKDEKIVTLEKEISDIGDLVVTQKGPQKSPEEELRLSDIEWGKWWCAYRKRFGLGTDKARDFLNKIPDEKLQVNGNYIKTDLGTPLTGDATGTDAQYLIPSLIFDTQIIRTMEVASEVIPLFTRKPMVGRKHRYAVENDVAVLTFVTNEVTSKTESNPDWTNVDLECETFATWIGITDELLEDTFADIGAQIRTQVMESYQNTVESQMLEGSSPFTGVLSASGTKSKVMDTTSIANLDWDDMQGLVNTLTTKKTRAGAVFMMHPTIWDILTNYKDANGQYMYRPDLAGPKMCKGFPVKLTDNMPQLSDDAAETAFIVFGNPKWLFYGIRMGLEFKYFDQTMYAVQDDENFWRARTRFACKVALPGNYAVLSTKA